MPLPSSVNSSSSSECGWRPSRMWALPTPDSSACRQASSFGPHSAAHLGQAAAHLVRLRLRDAGGGIGGIGAPALHVGQEDHLEGVQGAGHGGRGGVGVHVVGAPLAVGAHRGHDGDVVLGDVVQHVGVHVLDLPHHAHVGGAGERASHGEEPAVVAAEPHRGLSVPVDEQHDVLVLLAHQHHLGHLDGGLVGHAQPVHEAHLHAEALHVAGDVGAAAVHHHRVHAHVLEEHHVAGEVLGEHRVGHGRAAVLDHHGLPVELPDVGKRLEECGYVPHEV